MQIVFTCESKVEPRGEQNRRERKRERELGDSEVTESELHKWLVLIFYSFLIN